MRKTRRDITYRPEVVHQDIEDAKNEHQKGRAELGLEADHDHDAGDGTYQRDNNPPRGPLTGEDEADEEEDEQDTTGKLEVHLAVLLVKLREAGEGLGLAHPRVGEDHEETADDGEVSEEEVEVEDKAVAEGLGNDDGAKTGDGVVRVLADDDKRGAGQHGENVSEEEEVREAIGD